MNFSDERVEFNHLLLDAENASYALSAVEDKAVVQVAWSETIHKISEHLDKYFIYINEEVAVPCN